MKAYVRLIAILVWVFLTFSYRLLGFLIRPFSQKGDNFFRRTAFRACAKGVLAITGIRLSVEGPPPTAPFFLVSNHISFFDVFIIASELGCVFVSKSELGKWPVFGFIAHHMSTILIDRKDIRDTKRVNGEISKAMNDGLGVVVFAEGGVSQTGELLPFKAPLLQPAVDLEMPVNFATVHYATSNRTEAMAETILWRDGVSFIRHFLNIGALSNCEAKIVFSSGAIQREDRKSLARDLFIAVSDQQLETK
jgi:1-acyl-sn-glycerol-3-phosphate acyltransferase